MKIGVLALQGGFREHMQMLEMTDTEALEVRCQEDLDMCDGLIIPGGESTAIGLLLEESGLKKCISSKIRSKMPVFGTCAGMILLSSQIEGESAHIGAMDISVKRNAYGRQLGSFHTTGRFDGIEHPIEMVFIRGPYISSHRENVSVLSKVDGHIVAARQDNLLVTSFHPELTKDTSVHEHFLSMVKNSQFL